MGCAAVGAVVAAFLGKKGGQSARAKTASPGVIIPGSRLVLPAFCGDVWLADTGGASWTKTETISPPAGNTLIKPGIAYSPTGDLGVVWRNRYADTSYDIYAEVSKPLEK